MIAMLSLGFVLYLMPRAVPGQEDTAVGYVTPTITTITTISQVSLYWTSTVSQSCNLLVICSQSLNTFLASTTQTLISTEYLTGQPYLAAGYANLLAFFAVAKLFSIPLLWFYHRYKTLKPVSLLLHPAVDGGLTGAAGFWLMANSNPGLGLTLVMVSASIIVVEGHNIPRARRAAE